jgi:sulfur-oxidizing protein SoxY
VEKNPLPLICSFMFTNNLKPYVSTRIKMQETSNVIVVATSSGGNYKITKSVNVAAGGC